MGRHAVRQGGRLCRAKCVVSHTVFTSAMETFSQLVMHDGTVLGMGYEIVDQPRFPWRGFLIDTARHFMPVRNVFVRALLSAL